MSEHSDEYTAQRTTEAKMADDKEKVEMTTVQVDTETRNLLKELAAKSERSMAAQIRFMVKQALQHTSLEMTRQYVEENSPGTVQGGV